MCVYCRDHFDDCLVAFGPVTHTGAHSLPQPVSLYLLCPKLCHRPPTATRTHMRAPVWTNQTFGGHLIHSHLHNEAFVTRCPILPKANTAMAQRAHCGTPSVFATDNCCCSSFAFEWHNTLLKTQHKHVDILTPKYRTKNSPAPLLDLSPL